ncbi:hypothetical protein [Shewanella gaetbuli]|uniref:Lipoprotein n=1 Tax=Shewanella gaetbuli TaxID=220752 RepID=A0A9X1ZMZ4_9GAMM|nr:hypothetical protein [Shewanella gaetbuli]MCL1142702.1 hypothetical protein [Shewanella gaetbuli]
MKIKTMIMMVVLTGLSGCAQLACDARTDGYTNELDRTLDTQSCEKQVDASLKEHADKKAQAEREASDKLLKESIEQATQK